MTTVELKRERDLNEILRDAFALFRADMWTYIALTLVVVVPIQVIVFGIALNEIGDRHIADPSTAATVLGLGLDQLLTGPLASAIVISAMLNTPPSVRRAVPAGLELFVPVLVVSVVFALALGPLFVPAFLPDAWTLLSLLTLPLAVFIAVRFAFVIEAVVIDGKRGLDAFRHSSTLTRGWFWRVLGIVMALNLIALAITTVMTIVFDALAQSADAQVFVLLGQIISQGFSFAPVAIGSALLFFDLHTRRQVVEPA